MHSPLWLYPGYRPRGWGPRNEAGRDASVGAAGGHFRRASQPSGRAASSVARARRCGPWGCPVKRAALADDPTMHDADVMSAAMQAEVRRHCTACAGRFATLFAILAAGCGANDERVAVRPSLEDAQACPPGLLRVFSAADPHIPVFFDRVWAEDSRITLPAGGEAGKVSLVLQSGGYLEFSWRMDGRAALLIKGVVDTCGEFEGTSIVDAETMSARFAVHIEGSACESATGDFMGCFNWRPAYCSGSGDEEPELVDGGSPDPVDCGSIRAEGL